MRVDWKDTADIRQGQLVHLRERGDILKSENADLHERNERLRTAVIAIDAYWTAPRHKQRKALAQAWEAKQRCKDAGDLDPPEGE